MIPIRLIKGKALNLMISGQRHDFRVGESRSVSTEVAELCLAKKDNLGNPLFERVEVDSREIQEVLGIQTQWHAWPTQASS